LSPSSLRTLAGIKSKLGATKFKQRGDEVSLKMCLLLSANPSVFVDKKYVDDLCSKFKENNVVFEESGSD
jgi:hypothetical protein